MNSTRPAGNWTFDANLWMNFEILIFILLTENDRLTQLNSAAAEVQTNGKPTASSISTVNDAGGSSVYNPAPAVPNMTMNPIMDMNADCSPTLHAVAPIAGVGGGDAALPIAGRNNNRQRRQRIKCILCFVCCTVQLIIGIIITVLSFWYEKHKP